MTNVRDRIVELRRVPASQLSRHGRNWRTHPDGQKSALLAALEQVGIVDAVIAREGVDGNLHLIDGHLRADIAGADEVPVLVVDLTEEEAEFVLATHDSIGGMAGIDAGAAITLLADLSSRAERNDNVDQLFEAVAKQIGVDALLEDGPSAAPLPFDDPSWDIDAEIEEEDTDAAVVDADGDDVPMVEVLFMLPEERRDKLLVELTALRKHLDVHMNGEIIARAVERYAEELAIT